MPNRINLVGASTKRIRTLYRAQNAIWLWLGAAAVLSLVGWLVDPGDDERRSALGRSLANPIDDAWHVLLGVGGVAVFYGVWTMSIRAEIIGHLFVAISVLINAVAVTVIRGITPPTLILYGVAFASVSRIWFLVATAEKRRIVGDST